MSTTENNGAAREMTFEERCSVVRERIKHEGETVQILMLASVFKGEQKYSGQHGEMKANIMLAYRHLEDARMRIGKVLQAAGDGVSIFDKK